MLPRHQMRDLIILLPGITGSTLTRKQDVLWGYSGQNMISTIFSRGKSLSEALTLQGDDPTLDDLQDGIAAKALMPDLHLLPGLWKIDGYTKVAEFIRQTFDVKDGENFFQFPYDWRRDNRVSARKLQREANSWLTRWRSKVNYAEAKLILVAHSMGGLVSRYFLEALDGWQNTRALITFGTPYRGSLNALDALANGITKGPGNFIDLSEMIRSFTSTYQLLPIYECLDQGDGSLVYLDRAALIPNVDLVKVKAALAFHREIKDAVDRHLQDSKYLRDRYRIFPIVGIIQETGQSARVEGHRVVVDAVYKGKDMSGDGTVPRVSATPIEMRDETTAMFAATKHGALQNADPVLVQMEGAITGLDLDLGSFRVPSLPPVKLALEVDDLYSTGDPIVIRVRPTAHVATLMARVSATESDTEVAVQSLKAHDEWLETQFGPLTEGCYRVEVSGGSNVEPAADAFICVESA